MHDRLSNVTERVSVASGGAQAHGPLSPLPSNAPSLSTDGRFVAFESVQFDLALGDANGTFDVFVHDRVTGTTELVSVGLGGLSAGGEARHPSLSADGRFVAFLSPASDLVAADTNGHADIFVRDRLAGVTTRVSVASGGGQSNHLSASPTISADGRFVAFDSFASNLVASDTNATFDVFVHDRLTTTTERISVSSSGLQSNVPSLDPALSADGRLVVFHSGSTTLAPGITIAARNVFLRERTAGTTELVSFGTAGPGNDASSDAAISGDGNVVAFTSAATNLVPGDTNAVDDIYARDRAAGRTERVSVDDFDLQSDLLSRFPAVDGVGRFVAFGSRATNLVPNDTNATIDVFARDRRASFAEYCFGDGPANGGPDCPCGNNVPVGVRRGCVNSFGAGARLQATGQASLSADSVLLTATGMPPSAFALFLQSPSDAGGGLGQLQFFDGLRCIGSSFQRLSTKQAVAGGAALGAPSVALSLLGAVAAPGLQYYQVVYRNNGGLCNFLANSTSGASIVWEP